MADIFDTYGDRYEELLPEILSDIDTEISVITRQIESGAIDDSKKLEYLLENQAELKSYIENRFNEGYQEAIKGGYSDTIKQTRDVFTSANVDFNIGENQLDFLSQIKRQNALYWGIEASASANLVFNNMLQWAFTGSGAVFEPFRAELDRLGLARYGDTIINTQVSNFYRSTTVLAAEAAGVTRYRYSGPSPDRKFCEHVLKGDRDALGISDVTPSGKGRVYTIEEIRGMDNKQIPDVLRSAGGYNCRHTWIPVSDA